MLKTDDFLQNRYRIVRTIGKGGMGAVYQAQDTRLGHTIALKETFFAEEGMRRAFEREARLLASLRHPALPRVTDHFTENEGQFLVMEFIPGDDLESLLARRQSPFPMDEVLDWSLQLLDALEYLHKQDPPVIHRDLKPQNLKLSGRQVILLDFGLAKGHATGMTETSGKSLYGYTATYAPLEQIRNHGTDERSDLYALGATLYHLLTGLVPADALLRADAILGGKPDPLRPLHEVNPRVPPAVSRALHLALALHNGQRPPNAAALRQILANARQNPMQTVPAPTLIMPPAAVTAAQEETVVDLRRSQIRTAPIDKKTTPNGVSTIHSRTKAEGVRASRAALSETRPAEENARPKNLYFALAGLALLIIAGVVWAFNSSEAARSAAVNPETSVRQELAPEVKVSGEGGVTPMASPSATPTPGLAAATPAANVQAAATTNAPNAPAGTFSNVAQVISQATPQTPAQTASTPQPQQPVSAPATQPSPATQPAESTPTPAPVRPAPQPTVQQINQQQQPTARPQTPPPGQPWPPPPPGQPWPPPPGRSGPPPAPPRRP